MKIKSDFQIELKRELARIDYGKSSLMDLDTFDKKLEYLIIEYEG